MIDTHAHVHDLQYDSDRAAVLQRAFDAGVNKIITIGTSLRESRDAVNLAQKHKNIFATVGLHPHVFNGGAERDQEWEVGLGFIGNDEKTRKKTLEKALKELQELSRKEKVVAIGEVGLDYYGQGSENITEEQKTWQKEGLLAQLQLARESKLPVVIHCRDAYEDMYRILTSYKQRPKSFVLHCYGGNVVMTEKFLGIEYLYISFSGNVTYSKHEIDESNTVVKMVPLERMMIETDCPYLAPVPHRGKRNEPAYVKEVARYIAKTKEINLDEVAQVTTKNAQTFFHFID